MISFSKAASSKIEVGDEVMWKNPGNNSIWRVIAVHNDLVRLEVSGYINTITGKRENPISEGYKLPNDYYMVSFKKYIGPK